MKFSRFCALFIGLILCLSALRANAETRYKVYRIPKPVKIDGLPDDAWQHIPEQRGFIYVNKTSAYSGLYTSFKIGYDNNNLYILIRADEPQMKECIEWAKKKGGQGIEILLDVPGAKGKDHYQYAVSILGKKLYELKADLDNKPFDIKNTLWKKIDLGWQKTVYYGNDYYTVEMAIPFKSLGIKTPKSCDEWGAQIGRFGTAWPRAEALKGLHWKLACWTAWVPMPSGFWKQVDEHGILEFADIVQLPDEQNAGRIEKEINKEFDAWRNTHGKAMGKIRQMIAKTEGKTDLCYGKLPEEKVRCLIDGRVTTGPTPEKIKNWRKHWPLWPWQRDIAHTYVMEWKKPVTFNCNVIAWKDAESYAVDYGLEYWDGKEWKLCYKKTGNNLPLSCQYFPAVTSDKLRLTLGAINSASYYFCIRNFKLFMLENIKTEQFKNKKTASEHDKISAMLDGKIQTSWKTPGPQRKGEGFVIDLGEKTWIQRLVLRNGKDTLSYPRSLVLSIGDSPENLKKFCIFDNSRNNFLVQSIRFNPVKGRFLGVKIGDKTSAYPWTVAELEAYRLTDTGNIVENAVILPGGMPEFVNQAARDVAYYVGEITGKPVAVVSPKEAGNYKGMLFVIDRPKLVKFKKGDILHRENEAVNVYRKGSEIHFGGATMHALMYSMFEFLDRQGVRWLYPSFDGDYISRRGKLDLSMLPIKYTPQFALRYFQVNKDFFGYPDSDNEAVRWLDHSHWNDYWSGGGSSYRDHGSHSFSRLVPGRLYKKHPEMFPMYTDKKWEPVLKKKGFKLGQRVPYRSVGTMGTSFCTSSPEAREYIVRTFVEKLKKNPKLHSLTIAEDDGNQWCECPRCKKQDKIKTINSYGNNNYVRSDRVVDLMIYIDRRLKELIPERTIQVATYSYQLTCSPPTIKKKLAGTLSTEICLYGGLRGSLMVPPSSPKNAGYVRLFKDWAKLITHLGVYPYDMLSPRYKIPVTRITALSKWFRFWKKLNMDAVTPQVETNPVCWKMMPWLYYAFARLSWHPDEPAEQILDDFFKGYYRESWKPMLAYYRTLENHILKNDLGKYNWQTRPDLEIFSLPILKEMNKHLKQARLEAKHYLTIDRVDATAKSFKYILKLRDIKSGQLNK